MRFGIDERMIGDEEKVRLLIIECQSREDWPLTIVVREKRQAVSSFCSRKLSSTQMA
jgi:hypothetical protein